MTTARRLLALFSAAVFSAAASASFAAAALAEASARLQTRLDTSLADFSALRTEMAAVRVPLAEEINSLENDVIAAARELEREQRLRDNRGQSLRLLEQQARQEREQTDYVSSLLADFARTFESRVHLAELQRHGERLRTAQLVLEEPDFTTEKKLVAQLDALIAGLDRLDSILGGDRFPGSAITDSGAREPGTFLVLGPTAYFASANGSSAGLVQTRFNTADPVAISLGSSADAAIRAAIADASAPLPLDITLGKAVQLREASETVFEHLAKGRTVGYVILGLGAVAFVIGLYKLSAILRYRSPSTDDVQKVLETLAQDGSEQALHVSAKLGGAASELLTIGVRRLGDKRRVLEEALYEVVLKARPKLESLLPFLAVTAAAAPLLGLLGTVVGMIRTFGLIAIFGTGDAKSLSSGISEALVTTELGLCVAIPALVFHGILNRLAKARVADLEHAAVAFLNGVSTTRNRAGLLLADSAADEAAEPRGARESSDTGESLTFQRA